MAGLVKKFKDMWTPPEDDYGYEDDFQDSMEDMDEEMDLDMNINDDHADNFYEEEQTVEQGQVRRTPMSSNQNSKVVNIHATAQLQVVISKPTQFGEETRAVADELLKMHTVVLNLENTSKDISRRILDFLSGVAYANNGKIKRVATSTFIITPYNVDLTGDDLMGELENNGVYF